MVVTHDPSPNPSTSTATDPPDESLGTTRDGQSQEAALQKMPPVSLIVPEERKRDRSRTRGQATRLVSRIEAVRQQQTPDQDELAYLIQEAKELQLKLMEFGNSDPDGETCDQSDKLKETIFKAERMLLRLERTLHSRPTSSAPSPTSPLPCRHSPLLHHQGMLSPPSPSTP